MKIISVKIVFFCFVVSLASPLHGESSFLTVIDDMPLANDLTEESNSTIMFETSQGRIAYATAIGTTTFGTVKRFYSLSLPQLGWKSDAIQKGWHYSSLKWVATWHRGAEKLTIELENINDVMHVNFILIPRHNTTQHRRNK
tara:strand:- start:20962 stop:21387 length:426 start_codon:yes stop_codon:yes gene_type:complete